MTMRRDREELLFILNLLSCVKNVIVLKTTHTRLQKISSNKPAPGKVRRQMSIKRKLSSCRVHLHKCKAYKVSSKRKRLKRF